MNSQQRQARLKALLKQIADGEDLESLAPSAMQLESIGGAESASPCVPALEKLESDRDLSLDELYSLEAIILPGKRPVIDIRDSKYLAPGEPFAHLNKPSIRQRLEPCIPAVGRLELPTHPSVPYVGTAFVVGEGLMMTNRHVAESFSTGLGRSVTFRSGFSAAIDFGHESDDQSGASFEIEKILMIHPYWDMALLKFTGLDHVQPLRLALEDPGDMKGDEVVVIGYPAMDYRNNAKLQNEIFGGKFHLKRMQPGKVGERRLHQSYANQVDAATHDASTLGGNSGSAVIHVPSGNVIALHYAGIYLEANYAVPAMELSRDRHVVDAQVNFDGVPRPTRTPWDSEWGSHESADRGVKRDSVTQPDDSPLAVPDSQIRPVVSGHQATWTIPLHVTVSIGSPQTPTPPQTVARTAPSQGSSFDADQTADDGVEKLVEPFHETDYSNRTGYDREFLGVALPIPTAKSMRTVARMDDGEHVLHYHHFSLVMHRTRRLAIFAAANIDGRLQKREPEDGKRYTRKAFAGMEDKDTEKWFNDPRLDEAFQLPNKFYDKDRKAFDKGHLVRREDVAWGDSYHEVMAANGDTFHVTNCSPQVGEFNRSNRGGIWGKLENLILKQAETEQERYSMFCGPVLKESDPLFEGRGDGRSLIDIQIPKAFWKIVVVNKNKKLQAYAFLLDQSLDNVDFDRELIFGDDWKKHQVSIEALEKELELVRFSATLKKADQFE
ncbi:MAG: DNA/RNA non-specific endonuclease [Planctomycetota bacterium]